MIGAWIVGSLCLGAGVFFAWLAFREDEKRREEQRRDEVALSFGVGAPVLTHVRVIGASLPPDGAAQSAPSARFAFVDEPSGGTEASVEIPGRTS